MKKIILGMLILFLLIGTVTAFDTDNLKNLDDCTQFEHGISNYTTHICRYFLVSPVQEYSMFENSTEIGQVVKSVGDNIYYFEEPVVNVWGYEELVDIDGETYLITIDQGSQLSPGEEQMLLEDMKEFNKMNNLKPLDVESVT